MLGRARQNGRRVSTTRYTSARRPALASSRRERAGKLSPFDRFMEAAHLRVSRGPFFFGVALIVAWLAGVPPRAGSRGSRSSATRDPEDVVPAVASEPVAQPAAQRRHHAERKSGGVFCPLLILNDGTE